MEPTIKIPPSIRERVEACCESVQGDWEEDCSDTEGCPSVDGELLTLGSDREATYELIYWLSGHAAEAMAEGAANESRGGVAAKITREQTAARKFAREIKRAMES